MGKPRRRAAVLCPGPSLASWLPRLRGGGEGEFDLVVAVNRTAKEWPADYWAILDAESFTDVTPVGTPELVIPEKQYKRLTRLVPDVGERFNVHLREALACPPRSTFWHQWSATLAVVMAWNVGARRIEVFGADLAGTADFDGVTLERHDRDARRWRRERGAWLLTSTWLRSDGVEVWRRQEPAGE